MASLLFGVSAADVTIDVAAITTLGAATILATAIPAVRAARVDPGVALRDS